MRHRIDGAAGWLALVLLGTTVQAQAQAAAAPSHRVDAGAFTLELPADWSLARGTSRDGGSHGTIAAGGGLVLEYDYSPQGWSRGLPQGTRAYLDDPNAMWVPRCPFCDAQGRPARDYTVEFAPVVDHAAYPQGDYVATLTRPNGVRQEVVVTLPDAVKYTKVQWTEADGVRRGVAVARRDDKGVNGVYLKQSATGATLVLRTESPTDQATRERLAQVFASIKPKGW